MDLTQDAIAHIIHPTAAFVGSYQPHTAFPTKADVNPVLWNDSELNPKNRIDSLDQVLNPRWRIDGATGMGTQFYTVPLFFTNLTPLRIDTFIPEQSKHPPELREILDLDTAFHYKDSRIARLGISRHILRTLEYWTRDYIDFETVYNRLPFGSRIVFENLARDIRNIRPRIVPTHYLERQLLSQTSLQSLWDIPASSWPELVDISQVHLSQQLHDSVSLVHIYGTQGSQTRILKALTSSPKYLYHELKVLLTLPSHPNIISRPHHLVTKKCCFGGKTAIIGFTTEYHPLGTLRDILPLRRIHGTLHIADQLKWAIQLTSALIHIRKHGRFYSDLRLDNILLSATGDLVMVDFEQRGMWCAFSAPEVNYLDYVHILASDSTIPVPVKERYKRLLQRYVPGYKDLQREEYLNPEHGYSVPWLYLGARAQEAAEVYMLCRVLWCIFEGLSSPEVAVWQSYQHESELQFPDYRRTPLNLRVLIDRGTKGRNGRGSGHGGGIVRRRNCLVLREGDGTETMEAVQNEATRWWKIELEDAEEYLEKIEDKKMNGDTEDWFGRPKLREVLEMLEDFQTTI